MARITKGMIAAALSELNVIHELAQEAHDSPTACYRYHAPAACRHIATLVAAGQPLPEYVIRNWAHLRVCGWSGV